MNIAVAPSSRNRPPLRPRTRVNAALLHHSEIADDERRPSTLPLTPFPAGASNPRRRESKALSSAALTIAAPSGCWLPRSTLAASLSTSASANPGAA